MINSKILHRALRRFSRSSRKRPRVFRAKDADINIIVGLDDTPIRGFALASGDDELDEKAEDELIEKVNSGDVWAWCSVQVYISWAGFKEWDSLGAVSCKDEDQFREAFLPDMVKVAFAALKEAVLKSGWPASFPESEISKLLSKATIAE